MHYKLCLVDDEILDWKIQVYFIKFSMKRKQLQKHP